jgi:hypothetical protein
MKKVQLIMTSLLLIFLAACNNGGKEPADETAGNVQSENSKSFQVLKFDKEVLSKLKDVKGDFLYGKRWEDKNGDNVLIFTLKEVFKKWKDADYEDMGDFTRYLKAYHFASADKQNYKLMRLIQDFNQNPCGSPPFLLEGDFYKESISITDLDEDNLGEATFMYYFNCASEINPRTVKLMLIEDGEKYAIRGNEYIKEYYPESGKKEFGSEFSKAPASFKSHASKVWEKYCKSNPNL